MKGNTFFYEVVRWTTVVLAVLSLIGMFGGNTISDAEPENVAAAVTQAIDTANMTPGDNQMLKRLYGLDPSAYESCILYYPATNMMAEELLIVKLADVAQAETVRAAAEARLDTQKNTFEGYGVEQYELLSNHCVLEVRGNYVLFLVHTNAGDGLDAFLDAL